MSTKKTSTKKTEHETTTRSYQPSTIGIVAIAAIVILLFAYAVMNNHKASNSTASNSSVSSSGTTQKLALKEFGVTVNLPSSLKDTTYELSQLPGQPSDAPKILDLIKSSYTTLADKCVGASSKTKQYYASLIKSPGSAPSGTTTLAQTSTYYIADLGPSVVKGTVCKDSATQKSLDTMAANMTSALKSSFSSLSK